MFLGQFRSENTGKIPKKIFGHYFPHKKGDIPQKSFFKGFLARKSQFQGGNSDQIIFFTFFSYSTVNLEPRMMVGKFPLNYWILRHNTNSSFKKGPIFTTLRFFISKSKRGRDLKFLHNLHTTKVYLCSKFQTNQRILATSKTQKIAKNGCF